MSGVDHLQSLTLDLPPSCIEFWPLDPQYAVIGTYNLEKSSDNPDASSEAGDAEERGDEAKAQSQQRNGSLILVMVEGDTVKILQTLSTASAVFDIHFGTSYQPRSLFGAATSAGSISLYHILDVQGNAINTLEGISSSPRLAHVKTCQYFPEDILVTAFTWNPNGQSVGMTLSTGEVCLGTINLDASEGVQSCQPIGTHDLEAWTLAFLHDGSAFYSGGDDSALRFSQVATIREQSHDEDDATSEEAETSRLSWADTRIHGAGVTAILPLSSDLGDSLVVTGSYDDHIRLLHAPSIGRRRILTEMNLEGGVWRLKLLSTSSTTTGEQNLEILLLASCMHAGARILKLVKTGDEDWHFEVLAKFEEHKSMNYGSDCQPFLNAKGQRTFISTSFYDRLLCLWRY